jgi:FAD:protein FMN transferase
MMGDVLVTLKVRAPQNQESRVYAAMGEAFQVAKHLEEKLSEFQPTSDTARLNQSAGKRPVKIGSDLSQVLAQSKQISQRTHGAFDVTYASPAGVSDKDVIVLPGLNYAFLNQPSMQVRVSGIAKGYIVDQMRHVLDQYGFKNYLIDAGDLYARGTWAIIIKHTECEVSLKDQAMSTSGAYERGPHIYDPRHRNGGAPFLSTTVIAPTAIESDALATAAFVMSREEVAKTFRSLPDIRVMVVQDRGGVCDFLLDSSERQ